MRQELAQQLKESEELLAQKRLALDTSKRALPVLTSSVKAKQKDYESLVKTVRTVRDTQMDQLLIKKGEIRADIENMKRQSQVAALIQSLEKNKGDLTSDIQSLGISIERRKQAQQAKRSDAQAAIERHTLRLLQNDLDREEMFKLGRQIKVDFSNNTFAIDGLNQFAASSVVFLKNSVHFGIFFASLELGFFRYPRFILCDNTEDKGMEEARSRNFQRLIVEFSKESQVQHQIILTTSMIDPALETPELCVGPAYSQAHKSLTFNDPPKPPVQ